MKTLCLDIEITPRKVFVWSGRNYEVDVIEEIEPWYMLCYSWQWMPGKTEVFSQRMSKKYKPGRMDDYEVVKKLRDLLDEADVVLTHNGKKFDIKKFNSRCLFHKIKPPSDFKQVDTYQLFKQNFAEDSNKLQEIASKYGLGNKIQHNGFSLWKAVMKGDGGAWKLMEKYNKRDVDLTVAAYHLIEKWLNRPKVVWYNGKNCPYCQSLRTYRRGTGVNQEGMYQKYQCRDCAKWFSGNKIIQKI